MVRPATDVERIADTINSISSNDPDLRQVIESSRAALPLYLAAERGSHGSDDDPSDAAACAILKVLTEFAPLLNHELVGEVQRFVAHAHRAPAMVHIAFPFLIPSGANDGR